MASEVRRSKDHSPRPLRLLSKARSSRAVFLNIRGPETRSYCVGECEEDLRKGDCLEKRCRDSEADAES